MDPNKTYSLFFDAIENEDFESVIEHGTNLQHWLENGGFEPEWFARAHFMIHLAWAKERMETQ